MKMNEEARMDKLEKFAGQYHEKYRDQMDLLEKSPLLKCRRDKSLTAYDVWALGKQLEQFENQQEWLNEEQGNVN